jgi:hypothetical protein
MNLGCNLGCSSAKASGRDGSKLRSICQIIRRAESCLVEQVEEFAAQLKPRSLSQVDLLVEGEAIASASPSEPAGQGTARALKLPCQVSNGISDKATCQAVLYCTIFRGWFVAMQCFNPSALALREILAV